MEEDKLTGQFRAIKGSELQRLINQFVEDKYDIEVDVMDATFFVKGDYDSIKKIALDSCQKKLA